MSLTHIVSSNLNSMICHCYHNGWQANSFKAFRQEERFQGNLPAVGISDALGSFLSMSILLLVCQLIATDCSYTPRSEPAVGTCDANL